MSEILSNVFAKKKTGQTEATPDPTLYEQLGGEAAVNVAVDIFYRKVLADARINYFFFGVNIAEQAAKQKSFLAMAFGGPHQYTGRDMRQSHAKLLSMGMNDKHFDIVVEHLHGTLLELGVAPELIKRVVEICESTRDDVMGRSARVIAVRPVTSVPESPVPLNVSHQPSVSAPVTARSDMKSAATPGFVSAIMSTRPTTLTPGNTIREATELFGRGGVNSLPVVDESGRLVGLLTSGDLIRYLSEQKRRSG